MNTSQFHTTTHWGQYRVKVQNGKVVALLPSEKDTHPSPISQGFVDTLYAPSRIQQPMIRKSWLEKGHKASTQLRGKEPFVAVSWEKAAKIVAQELSRIIKTYGNQAIFGGSYGWASAGRFHHAQSQLHRFLNCIGGYTRSLNTYSYAAAEVIIPHILGDLQKIIIDSTSWNSIAQHAQLFVAFGGLRIQNTQINNGGLVSHTQLQSMSHAAKQGVQFVNISPIQSDTPPEIQAEWRPIVPNTDVHLMLAIVYTLYEENLYDANFIHSHTSGFEDFLPYLLGTEKHRTPKSPEWAETLTGIPANTIRNLARRMAKSRTMINLSFSLTRQEYGEYAYWTGVTLAAMLGQIGLPGGGIGLGYGTFNSIGNDYLHTPIASLPQGRNPVTSFIPVARISDMLLNPGKAFDYNGTQSLYPDIQLIYWAGGNPFHHHQDLAKMSKAWQKPQTIISHEWCWNPLAKHSDIVLPCTTSLERNDFTASPRDSFVSFMEKTTEPIGEARNDFDIFSLISEQLNIKNTFTEGRSEEQWIAKLYQQTRNNFKKHHVQLPSLKDLKTLGTFSAGPRDHQAVLLQDFRKNPQKYPLSTPSKKIQISSPAIASFLYEECLPHPMAPPLNEFLGNPHKTFPLHLISNQPHDKLHSQLDHGAYAQSQKIHERQPVTIHPEDAKKRNIKHHSLVRIFNNRGSCLATAVLSEHIRPRVIQISTGAWFDPLIAHDQSIWCVHGNPNILTQDVGTSRIAQGPSALSCLVDVEPYTQNPPTINAFSPPPIIKDV
jgi:biotin/methionine sulfoxide reductase